MGPRRFDQLGPLQEDAARLPDQEGLVLGVGGIDFEQKWVEEERMQELVDDRGDIGDQVGLLQVQEVLVDHGPADQGSASLAVCS